jgi:RNA polymerase sigma factor (sigma-70 family)
VDLDRLALAASRGDAAALNTLLATIRADVLRLCGRFLPNREDAEEACQDTLLAVSRGIGRYEGRASFRTWLHSVTANRARSTYQVLRRRSANENAATPMPDHPDPRRTSVVAGTRLDLLEGLEALGPRLAEPVALRDVLDLPYAEIAALLGLPEGTVRSRIHDGRRQLRERFADHG